METLKYFMQFRVPTAESWTAFFLFVWELIFHEYPGTGPKIYCSTVISRKDNTTTNHSTYGLVQQPVQT